VAIGLADRAAVFSGPHIHEQLKPDAIGGVYFPAALGRHKWGFKNFLPVLLYGTAPDLHLGAKIPTAILATNTQSEPNSHPCPKPVEWMEWLCRLASRDGDTILDPFLGSGTTAVACIRTGRKCIGIELEEKYCEIAAKRCDRELDQGRLFKPEPKVRETQMVLA
jgi:hypothetical protein